MNFKLLLLLQSAIWWDLSIALPALFSQLWAREALDLTDPNIIFTAIGDSYAAGIGAGDRGGKDGDNDCSRYTGAYSVVLNEALGPKTKFLNVACSGDESKHIKEQVEKLADGSQDLVTVSAGGNDALLSDLLKACIYTPAGQKACDDSISKTREVIDNTLQPNVEDLLKTLDPKVKPQGFIVYTLYGQFFNADTDACSDETWNWFEGVIPGSTGLKLTKELRKTLNELVVAANDKIKAAISAQKRKIAVADWDEAAGIIKGRFCEDGSASDPADKSNENLIFQRLGTAVSFIPGEKKLAAFESRDLQKRIPDDIARVFHPTELGQQLIASHCLAALVALQGDDNGPQTCTKPPLGDPQCLASSNQGVDKDEFTEARDAWCKDTSKEVDKSKPYGKYFSLSLEKTGDSCPTTECVDKLNSAWLSCKSLAYLSIVRGQADQ